MKARSLRSARRNLLLLLQRGIVTAGDSEEMVALLEDALALCGLVVADEVGFEGWNLVGGDLGGWPEIYAEIGIEDPCGEFFRANPAESVYLARQDPRPNPMFDAFIKEGFSDVAISRLPIGFGVELTTAMYRDRPGPSFDDDDVLFLITLFPHLSRALSTRSAHAALGSQQGNGNQIGGAVYVSFPSGAITWTQKARRTFSERLGPPSPQGWRRLERALRKVCASPSRSVRILDDVQVEVSCVPPEALERQRLLLTLVISQPTPSNLLRDLTPMTPAEELLSERQRATARLLGAGLSMVKIAQCLGIGEETVRSHFRTACERLGVEGKFSLASLVQTDSIR